MNINFIKNNKLNDKTVTKNKEKFKGDHLYKTPAFNKNVNQGSRNAIKEEET